MSFYSETLRTNDGIKKIKGRNVNNDNKITATIGVSRNIQCLYHVARADPQGENITGHDAVSW